MSIRRLALGLICWFCGMLALGQDSHYSPKGQLIPAPECLTQGKPCGLEDYKEWLRDIRHWREERRIRVGYDGKRYGDAALAWTQSSFIQPQMMVQDRYFYNPESGEYTVDRYLNDLQTRYGGIDSVLIWPTYPNMGIDNRNQLDMVRSMPGGVEGVRQMIAEFHRRHVRVLFPMMMWDQGTRDPGRPWPEAIEELMHEIGADGINGDTQDGVPLAFSEAAERAGAPLVFEPEGSPSDEALAWNVMTWGQYGSFGFVPGVDRFRWLEPRHMVNISDRWNRSKTDDLQYAFFNGEGWESWENIWGIWNGITPQDAEATRRVSAIERSVANFLTSSEWQPIYPMHRHGVFASRWPMGRQCIWTIVNRNEYDIEGQQMSVRAEEGIRYFDLYHGVELTPKREGGDFVLSFTLERHGFGAVLAADQPDERMQQLMTRMKAMTATPLSNYSSEWKPLNQTMVEIHPARQPRSMENMIQIPGGEFVFRIHGIEIEGSNDVGVDVQYPWEDTPRRFHEHRMQVKPFLMDKYPVTNANFKVFMDETHYHPHDDLHFLHDWTGGTYPPSWANKPVTWISLEDARAYAAWAGKRLPHEWEWQFAAEGNAGRAYPWGASWQPADAPVPELSRTIRGPDDVTAHPAGASAFGVMDMVGDVWQWTDEFTDDHTRAAILRGGSYYQPQGSMWYFPQAYKNNEHGKLLLMGPGYDRAATVGFRCVADRE